MPRLSTFLAGVMVASIGMAMAIAPAAVAQDGAGGGGGAGDGAGIDIDIDKKWLDRWKSQKIDVDKLKADLAKDGIAKISADYARDSVADEPRARAAAIAALMMRAMAGTDEQEGRGAIRLLERFGKLAAERERAPERFEDIAAQLPVGNRRTEATRALIDSWCELNKFDTARAALAAAEKAYGKQAPLVAGLKGVIVTREILASLVVGAKAPALAGTATDGTTVDTAAWVGSPVVVWFWSRTSKHCVVRLQEMSALAAKLAERGVRFLGVAVDEDPKALAQFAQDSGLTFPQLCEADGWNAGPVRAWAVDSVPRLWVLDGKGVVRAIDPAGHKALTVVLNQLLEKQ